MSRRAQPSTPSRSRQSQPSTTPLVPPPSHLINTAKSTTPAGLPPKSIFGSSYAPATFARNGSSNLKSFSLPESSPPPSEHDLPGDTQLDDTVEDPLELFGRNTLVSSIGTRGLKRSHDGRAKSDYTILAKSLPQRAQKAPDQLVLATESIVGTLAPTATEDEVWHAAQQLSDAWSKLAKPTKEAGIGPDTEDSTSTAAYLATLALATHCPSTTVPKALLDWVNRHHNPYPDDFSQTLSTRPAPSANESFWDVVYASVLRGKLPRAVKLLQNAGWEYAVTALDDGAERYTGEQLENTRRVARRAIDLLASCPAHEDDWDVRGAAWSSFRQHVRRALDDLQAASGSNEEMDDNIFSRSMQGSFSRADQRAGSRLPLQIYQNFKMLYQQLLGQADDILLASQDWVEGAIFLTVWWDGGPASDRTREVDVTPLHAYRERLADVLAKALTEPDFGYSINSTDAVHIGLACVMNDEVEGYLRVLQLLSLPIAAGVAYLASLDDWSDNTNVLDGLDSQDLLLLSQGPRPLSQQHDDILCAYAQSLQSRDFGQKEGWEIAAEVYGRVSNRGVGEVKTKELLDSLELDSVRTEKILQLCSSLGYHDLARQTAERFADASSDEHGARLIFYARAHAWGKLDSTLALLTSSCVVQSAAVPPQSKLDERLDSLLGDRIELLALGQVDQEAATYLASQLSGYATVRRFYELRGKKGCQQALLSLIASSADSIRGGLYDPSVRSVVPVDAILALLGELLPLCQQHVLTIKDVSTVLRVIEDFTAARSVHSAAEEVLQACKEAYNMSGSGLSGSSYEVLMASSEMVDRAWDWRKGLAGIPDLNAKSLISLLRVALAEQLGRLWIQEQ